MFLFILLLSHYSFCIAFFCDVVPLALFFSRCLFLRYCSLQVVTLLTLPLLALLFFTSCCSFRIIVLRVLSFLSRCRLFCVVLLTQLLLSCNFSYVVALVLLFPHCNSRIFPLALQLPHDSSHTMAPALLLSHYSSNVTPLELQHYVRYSSHITTFSHNNSSHTLFFSSTYSPSIYCSSRVVIVVPFALTLLLCFGWLVQYFPLNLVMCRLELRALTPTQSLKVRTWSFNINLNTKGKLCCIFSFFEFFFLIATLFCFIRSIFIYFSFCVTSFHYVTIF